MTEVFNFLKLIFDELLVIDVPGFNFTFRSFAIATFMFMSGISFIKFFVWAKSDGGEKY